MNKKYINKERKNETERKVQDYFISKGYKSITRGWPDFCFFRFIKGGKIDAIFVEVKRADQTMIKSYQNTIKKIFNRLGINIKVCFGANEDGSPNFKEVYGRKIKL